MLEALSAAATGGIMGGLFSLGNSAIDFVNKRQEAKERITELKASQGHELEMTKLNAETNLNQTNTEGKVSEMQASYSGLTATVSDQAALDQRVDGVTLDILALFRPGLTVLLVMGAIIAGSVTYGGTMTVFNSLIELSAMAVAWWFGDRQRMKFR